MASKMERRALGVVAIILIGLMAIVATAGLDNLPPSLKKSVDAAGGLLAQDRSAFEEDRKRIETTLGAEPLLFQHESASWRSRLDGDHAQLETAAAKLMPIDPATARPANAQLVTKRLQGRFRLDALRIEEPHRHGFESRPLSSRSS
jgi:ferric-dicitrate binding protein FerR (iron transport regulator)